MKKERGAISVYLALMMAVLIPLLVTMIESARVNAIKLRLECAADLSMDSVLAEYNKALMDRYDLLFVDTMYDGGQGSVDKMLDHLDGYLEYNIKPDKGLPIPGNRDHTKLSLYSSEATAVHRATDEEGAVFRYMAMSYMLEKYGLAYVADIQDMVETSAGEEFHNVDVTQNLQDAQDEVDAIIYPEPEPEYDEEGNEIEWTPPKKDDPASAVVAASKGVLLSQVVDGEISGASADLSCYASHRDLVVGNGMCEDWEAHDSITEQILFSEYILEKCGNYRNVKEGSRLSYEAEYIIGGKDNDKDNLSFTAMELMAIRGGSNTMAFYMDDNKRQQAKGLAEALAFVIALPEAAEAFEILICCAWIYAETIFDLKRLFRGGRVPLIKKAEDWNLTLDKALLMQFDPGEGGGEGQDYADYLRMIFYLEPLELKTQRCMDIVEMDIRQVSGYADFCLDNCVAGATVQMIFNSWYGYSFFMERRFRYA